MGGVRGYFKLTKTKLVLVFFSLCLFPSSSLYSCVQMSPFYKDASHIGSGLTLFQDDLILTSCTCNSYFSIRSLSEILRISGFTVWIGVGLYPFDTVDWLHLAGGREGKHKKKAQSLLHPEVTQRLLILHWWELVMKLHLNAKGLGNVNSGWASTVQDGSRHMTQAIPSFEERVSCVYSVFQCSWARAS